MKAILFTTTEALQSFNNNEARYRHQDLGMTTKYVWASDGLYLLVGDGLPQHTDNYELVDYTPPIIEGDI